MVVKIEKKKYYIPTTWREVTCGKFQELILAKDIFDKIQVLTGISRQTAEQLDWQSIQILQAALNFTNDFTMLDGVKVYPKELDTFDISKQPSHTILAVQGVFKKSKEQTDDDFIAHLYAGVDMLNIYINEAKKTQDIEVDIYNEPITDWYGTMCFFLSKWVAFSLDTVIYQITNQANMNYKRGLRTYLSSLLTWLSVNRLWKNTSKA